MVIHVIIIIISVLAFLWSPPPEIDSYRYYEYAKTISSTEGLFVFILHNIRQTFDFLYYTFFYFASLFNIPFQFVTGISIYLLLKNTFYILLEIKNQYNLNVSRLNIGLIFLMICTSLSFVNLFGISRFVCAMMFFAIGFKNFLRGNIGKSYFYFACAIFTHVGLIAYVILFLLSKYFSSKLIKVPNVFVKIFIIVLLPISLFSYLWIDSILNLLSKLWVLESNYDYVRYFKIEDKGNFLSFELGLTDLLMFIGIYVLITLFFLNTKRFSQLQMVILMVYFCMGISLGFSQMWVQRTLLFFIPFIGIIPIFYLDQNNNKLGRSFCHLLAVIWFLLFLSNLYSYRTMLNFNLP